MTEQALSDEMLMAYVDGELDVAAVAEVEAAFASDPAIAVRVVGFIRSRRLARVAYGQAEQVPASLRAAVEAAIARQGGASEVTKVVAFPVRSGRVTARIRIAVAVAATLLIGLAGGRFLMPDQTLVGSDSFASLSPLAPALSTARTGQSVETPLGGLTVAESYFNGEGQLCRTFALAEKQSQIKAVACDDQGDWQLRLALAEAAPQAGGEDYAPAGGSAALDSFLSDINAGAPLVGEDELKALEGLKH